MKRNRCILMSVSLVALALIFIAAGCSTSNPVAPDTSSQPVNEDPKETPNRLQLDDTGTTSDGSGERVPESEYEDVIY